MLSGIQKVGILFSILGESLAMSLVKGLSRTEIRKYVQQYKRWPNFFFCEKRVMEEFYFGFLRTISTNYWRGSSCTFWFFRGTKWWAVICPPGKRRCTSCSYNSCTVRCWKRMKILDKYPPTEKGQLLIELGSLDDIPLEAIIEVGEKKCVKKLFFA